MLFIPGYHFASHCRDETHVAVFTWIIITAVVTYDKTREHV